MSLRSDYIERDERLPDGGVRHSLWSGHDEVAAIEVEKADGIFVIRGGHFHTSGGGFGRCCPSLDWIKAIVESYRAA